MFWPFPFFLVFHELTTYLGSNAAIGGHNIQSWPRGFKPKSSGWVSKKAFLFYLFPFQGHTCGTWKFPAYTAACSNAGSLTHGARPGIEPIASQTVCWVLNLLSHNENSQESFLVLSVLRPHSVPWLRGPCMSCVSAHTHTHTHFLKNTKMVFIICDHMLNTDISSPYPKRLFLLQTPFRPQESTLPHPLPCFLETILSLETVPDDFGDERRFWNQEGINGKRA